jgi:hypothetical protein
VAVLAQGICAAVKFGKFKKKKKKKKKNPMTSPGIEPVTSGLSHSASTNNATAYPFANRVSRKIFEP